LACQAALRAQHPPIDLIGIRYSSHVGCKFLAKDLAQTSDHVRKRGRRRNSVGGEVWSGSAGGLHTRRVAPAVVRAQCKPKRGRFDVISTLTPANRRYSANAQPDGQRQANRHAPDGWAARASRRATRCSRDPEECMTSTCCPVVSRLEPGSRRASPAVTLASQDP